MNTREDKRMVKLEKKFETVLFGYVFKKLAHLFLVHGHSSWFTFSLHLVKGPKTL